MALKRTGGGSETVLTGCGRGKGDRSVIVSCERCTTQFRLDASRVAEPGVLVRCSRCRHAFVVKPPPPSDPDPIEAAAERAVASAGAPEVDVSPPAQEPATQDDDAGFDWEFDNGALSEQQVLAERARSEDTAEPARAPDSGSAADVDVEALLDLDSDASDTAHSGEPPVPERFVEPSASETLALASDPAAEELAADGDELGSPVDWDISSAPPPRAAAPARVAASAGTPERRVAEPPGSESERAARWLRLASGVAGWLATAALCAFGLTQGLAPPAAVEPAAMEIAPGLALDELRGRWIENLHLGELYVVSGRVRNESGRALPMPVLEAVLRDADGEALSAALPVGVPKSSDRLREAGGADLTRVMPSLVGGTLRDGEVRGIELVVWPLPSAAQRLELQPSR